MSWPGPHLWKSCSPSVDNFSPVFLQFVAKKEKISEREAGIKLLKSIPGVKPASQVKAKAPEPKPVLTSAQSAALLQRVEANLAGGLPNLAPQKVNLAPVSKGVHGRNRINGSHIEIITRLRTCAR